jgi:hypothetical protein
VVVVGVAEGAKKVPLAETCRQDRTHEGLSVD